MGGMVTQSAVIVGHACFNGKPRILIVFYLDEYPLIQLMIDGAGRLFLYCNFRRVR